MIHFADSWLKSRKKLPDIQDYIMSVSPHDLIERCIAIHDDN